MKKTVMSLLAMLLIMGITNSAYASLLDLSGFGVIENEPGSVQESGGTISFAENSTDAALYFYNDSYVVASNATKLSFDWDFSLGQFDYDDYAQFNVNNSEQWFASTPGSGHFEFDLTPYQGTSISLDWALIWGGDSDAGTTANIYNIDVAAPVPVPGTILLLGSGLAGICAARRRKSKLRGK